MAVSAVKKDPVKPAADAEAAPPPPKKRAFNWKLPLIILCVLGALGGGAYWYMHRAHSDAAGEANAEPVKPPQFLALDPFTVNLQLEENPQFLQVGLTLKVSSNTAIDALKLHMPEVRDRVLLLLSSQKAWRRSMQSSRRRRRPRRNRPRRRPPKARPSRPTPKANRPPRAKPKRKATPNRRTLTPSRPLKAARQPLPQWGLCRC